MYQLQNERKYSILFFIIFFMSYLTTIQSLPYNEYNYTFNLHESKIQVLSQINGVRIYNESYSGDVLSEFLIKEPKQIDNVVQIIVFQNAGNSQQSTNPTQLNPNQLLSAPKIDKVWIDYYSWPIKKSSLHYFIESQQYQAQQKKGKIVSAVYATEFQQNSIKKILSDDLQIYILLSTGDIQLLTKDHQRIVVQKTYSGSLSQEEDGYVIQWTDAQMFYKNGRLHLFVEEKFFLVSLNEIDGVMEKLVFYKLFPISGLGSVQKVVETSDLFIFTNEGVYKFKNNQAEKIINFTDLFQAFPEAKKQFIDFTVFGDTFYLLNQQQGVIKYSQGKYQLLRIQHPQLANSIVVQNQTILITYEIGNEEFIQQYHFVDAIKQFFVNKVYTYHSQEPVGDILTFGKEIIFNRGADVLYGLHSLSRKLPDIFNKQTQILESKSFNNEVFELRPIWSDGIRLPGYIVVTQKQIQLVELQDYSRSDIQEKWVSISSETSGVLNFDIEFIGKCRNSFFYPSKYCSITKSVQLTIKDHVNQEISSWWIWLCVAIGVIIILGVVIFIFYKYFVKKQNEFENLLTSKKLKNQDSTIEISLENASEITQQKKSQVE